ncbi:hypothetical protein MB901379_04108 [Mycobacterium basiliense]|uniref:Secreted protein n=1 Tax=Mycobacterium basiliense TaxID=2094119 RepID=A0A3S4FTN8_9MYCO|nr:hypothetical protein [Mycobacterium basiliense]VDM90506.1 hypothetical protein MB901379_04108 [Mycobacterium basiliense]
MRSTSMVVGAILMAGSVSMASPAWAYNPAINGTYTATVIGDWARTNTVYHDEPVVRSIWTITSSCSTAQDCSGQVASDQGWTAPLTMHDGQLWTVKRDLPNWETCPDGTTFTGHDVIYFYPANPETGETQLGSPVLAGREKTTGPSGACGNNAPLYIEQPFRLDKIG